MIAFESFTRILNKLRTIAEFSHCQAAVGSIACRFPFAAIFPGICRGIEPTRFSKFYGVIILNQEDITAKIRACLLRGRRAATSFFNRDHRFSIGLRPGLFPGHFSSAVWYGYQQNISCKLRLCDMEHHPAGKWIRNLDRKYLEQTAARSTQEPPSCTGRCWHCLQGPEFCQLLS